MKRLALLLLALASACSGEPTPPPPNVLVYVVDTLRADALGFSGNPAARTPYLDRFAAESHIFAQAYSSSSWTRPAMATLLTGTRPSWHGARSREHAISPGVETLAERFRAAGYATAFITANPNAGSFFGFGRGFDHMEELYARRDAGRVGNRELVATSRDVTDAALAWLETAPRPFFLVTLAVDPHSPYGPPARFAADVYLQAVKAGGAPRDRKAALDMARSLYAAEVSFVDESFGHLIKRLEVTGEIDSTVLVVTSDHGEEFGEHGGTFHGQTLYQEVLRIPLAIRHPARFGAGQTTRPVALVDVAPTLFDLTGVAPPERLDGASLADPLPERRPVFASLEADGHALDAVVDDSWKLIVDRKDGKAALYELQGDPGEHRPVAVRKRKGAAAAARRLRSLLAEQDRARGPDAAPAAEISPEARATLEALGYLE